MMIIMMMMMMMMMCEMEWVKLVDA
jgi:hypothetical protein